jgi:hypothetical protein
MEASLPLIDEAWVRKAVTEMAERLGAELEAENNSKGLSVLSRLISDPRMQSVWRVLYAQARDRNNYEHTGEFFHKASVLPASRAQKMRNEASELRIKGDDLNLSDAKLLEAEARAWEALPDFSEGTKWSEQYMAVHLLFGEACRSFSDIEPTLLSQLQTDAERFTKIACNLREQAIILESLGWFEQAETLADIANDCEQQFFESAIAHHTDEPEAITRRRGDTKLRTYIVRLSILTTQLFPTPQYGVLAALANVVFETDSVTSDNVRDIVRNSSGV